MSAGDPPAPPRGAARRAAVILAALACALALLLAVSAWILTPFRIRSESMEPTLQGERPDRPGDTIVVNRLAYALAGPRRWDIVTFRAAASGGAEESIVKRIVGLPGESIEIRDGLVLADVRPLERPPSLAAVRYLRTGTFSVSPVRLGPEEYFVLGDNSYLSLDSRRFGPLRRSSIFGRVEWIVLPWGRLGPVR